MVNPANLRVEVASNRRTGSHVSLHDVANNFDRFAVLEDRRILVGLLNDAIPLYHVSICSTPSVTSDILPDLDMT